MSKNYSQYQKRHLEYVHNRVAKAIMDYKLIENGDKVLVAISGGKDSLVMLDALSVVRKYGLVDFSVHALHIDITDVDYKIDRKKIADICRDRDVTFEVISAEADIENRGKKAPCFVCSWHRRKLIFSYAKENGFKKVAMGHHKDDAVETLLINMAYHGNISSLPAKLSMFDGKILLIRPLLLLNNKDTAEYANIRKYPALKSECPFEDTTKRDTAREIVSHLQKIHPKALNNIFNSMGNIDQEYLPE